VLVNLLEKPAKDWMRLDALARMISQTPEMREAYAALHAGLQLSSSFESGKSILVASTQPNEGKTTVAAGLAIAASLAGQRALLIDGDLRRPSLASVTGIAPAVGLGEVLEGRASPAEAVHVYDLFKGSQEAGPLSVMVAGQKSPAFLPTVDWAKARSAFQSLSQQFDIILLDSPPILAANDALLLAGIVDAVLLVIGAGSAHRDEVRRVKEQLEATGTPVIGAVLNMFDPKVHGRSNQPYRGYNIDPRS
jgi:capsular exopolysaccharide synthesis family protein